MPMSETEYFRMEEDAANGKFVAECAKAIFDAHGAATMYALQHTLYKYTDAGISISFELHDGSFVYPGNIDRGREIADPWNHVRKIGVSSIVEGSDAEVPLEWIDLARYLDDEKYGEDAAQVAVAECAKLCADVDAEACRLWDEANDASPEENPGEGRD